MRILITLFFLATLILCCAVSVETQEASTPSAISSRIAELTPADKDIPDNPIVLADEIRRINEELEETRKSGDSLDRQLKTLVKNKDVATKVLQEVAGLNCDASPPNLPALMDQVDRLAQRCPILSKTTRSALGPTYRRETAEAFQPRSNASD